MLGGVFSEARKAARFICDALHLYQLPLPNLDYFSPLRRYDAVVERNIVMALIQVDGGNKPLFPVRKEHGFRDESVTYRKGGLWELEVGWLNFRHVNPDEARRVIDDRMQKIAEGRNYRGIIVTYDRAHNIPHDLRRTMKHNLDSLVWGCVDNLPNDYSN